MLDVDKKTFEPEVLQAEGKVLVDFYGDGCVPCAALMPHVHGFAEKYGDKMKFTSMNTSKARRVAIGQQVLGLPTIAIYENGQKIEELVKDDATPENVEEMIKRHI
ncbi:MULTISPECIES: thioredoxin TrxA [unclassified Adlercreutzia]|uniref:thioredoxin TrxA n=1 Tax=unclassified Adlercreutzia TaxID=2636013 RepID=UPI0013EA525D|nr:MULTISPECIES: thioredoxin family protein [unclassified Adlercreutzia]